MTGCIENKWSLRYFDSTMLSKKPLKSLKSSFGKIRIFPVLNMFIPLYSSPKQLSRGTKEHSEI
jgi:hypothetical protein